MFDGFYRQFWFDKCPQLWQNINENLAINFIRNWSKTRVVWVRPLQLSRNSINQSQASFFSFSDLTWLSRRREISPPPPLCGSFPPQHSSKVEVFNHLESCDTSSIWHLSSWQFEVPCAGQEIKNDEMRCLWKFLGLHEPLNSNLYNFHFLDYNYYISVTDVSWLFVAFLFKKCWKDFQSKCN